MSHTPGPWTVGQYTPSEHFKSIGNHSCVCDPVTLALIALTGPADDRQSQIDADLIAAAPDLLEALQAIIGHDAHSLNPYRVEAARAAIAKARGATC